MGESDGTIRVYRARRRLEPRAESVMLEGTRREADALLFEVRSRETSLNCDLLRPNSGLSVDFGVV